MKKGLLSTCFIIMTSFGVVAQEKSNALSFKDNSYVDIRNIANDLSMLENFTIEFWVNYKGKDNIDYNVFYGVNTAFYGNRMIIRCDGPTDKVNGSAVILLENSYDRLYIKGTSKIDDGKWHHIAFTYENKFCKLYVDGKLEALTTFEFKFHSNDIHSLGQEYDPGPELSEFYHGTMDDFRIWNYARTQEELYEGKDSELSGKENGLVVYYNFNQGIANKNNEKISTLANKAQPAMNGTLVNFGLNQKKSNFVKGKCLNPLSSVEKKKH